MQKHTKLYLDFFNYDTSDFIPCEICGGTAQDIHHIKARGMGGSKLMDFIENLMALCRNCHDIYGDKEQHRDFLNEVHANEIKRHTEKAKGLKPPGAIRFYQ